MSTPAATCGVPIPSGGDIKYFDVHVPSNVGVATYTLQADGVATQGMGGFTYTINHQNAKASTVTGVSGWSGSANCWVTKKGGVC